MTQAVLPIPGTTVSALRRHALANSLKLSSTLGYAASESNLGSLKHSPAYHHGPRHTCDLVGQCYSSDLDRPTFHDTPRAKPLRTVLPCAYRMTAIDPAMSNHRKYRSPCLEMPPSRSLPPVECCRGASRSRPQVAARLERLSSPTVEAMAVAVDQVDARVRSSSRRLILRTMMPGMNVRLKSSDLCI